MQFTVSFEFYIDIGISCMPITKICSVSSELKTGIRYTIIEVHYSRSICLFVFD